ncbi:hypothetical protein, partial [Azohydromonas australica]|uniref:hypothetical protein n=1 Tax=Azohydromonas australica TaxID=364039 RepID=UPI001B7FCC75
MWDADEAWTTTDAQGRFELTGFLKTALGRIVIEAGGIDIETGNAVGALFLNADNLGQGGELIVSPLTTLLALSPGLTEAQLKAALGIDPSIDLLTFDPVSAMDAGGAGAALGEQLFAAQQKAYALLQAATAVAGQGGVGAATALANAAKALGQAIAGGATDLNQITTQVFSNLVSDPAKAEVLAKAVQHSMQAIDKAYVANPGEMSLSEARHIIAAGDSNAPGYAEAVSRLSAAKAAASVSQTAVKAIAEQVAQGQSVDVDAVLKQLDSKIQEQEQEYNEKVVAGVNHEPTGSVVINGSAVQGQTLTVSHTLADQDGMGPLSFQWLVDGKPIDGATGSQLLLTQSLVGKAITVAVSYKDGIGAAEVVASE